jgi:malate synthase
MTAHTGVAGVTYAACPGGESVLTEGAMNFVADLERAFRAERATLLAQHAWRSRELASGLMPEFPARSAPIREDPGWTVVAPPADLMDRRVEIASPVSSRKVCVNALNSGAQIWVADLEDSTSPTWANMVRSQANLRDAVAGVVEDVAADGRRYQVGDSPAVIMVRPRAWHLAERNVFVDGAEASASLVDAGLYLHHCAHALISQGSGPYFYLPKVRGRGDARLWNAVFAFAERALDLPPGSIRATALIEDVRAAFEMPEILYELRERSAGLTAGRWDYLFSIVRDFRTRSELVLPPRSVLTMDVPFMRAYTDLLVQVCHQRGAHALGGVAAQLPRRDDPQAHEAVLRALRRDKKREVDAGFDGTWVIHPAFVDLCRGIFDDVLSGAVHQLNRRRDDVAVTAEDLLRIDGADWTVTEDVLRASVRVCLLYLYAWFGGTGSVAIDGQMEGLATVEIARSQIWQWIHHGLRLPDGRPISTELVRDLIAAQADAMPAPQDRRTRMAVDLLEEIALSADFPAFLTVPGYPRLLAG